VQASGRAARVLSYLLADNDQCKEMLLPYLADTDSAPGSQPFLWYQQHLWCSSCTCEVAAMLGYLRLAYSWYMLCWEFSASCLTAELVTIIVVVQFACCQLEHC